MLDMTNRLKKTWYLLLAPLLTLGAILFFFDRAIPANSTPADYWIKSIFFLLVLALVPGTSIYLARSIKKHRDEQEPVRLAIFEKIYRIRIYTLSTLALISLPLFHLSGDRAVWMIYGVLMILLVINYPSQGLVEKELHKE